MTPTTKALTTMRSCFTKLYLIEFYNSAGKVRESIINDVIQNLNNATPAPPPSQKKKTATKKTGEIMFYLKVKRKLQTKLKVT